MPNEHAVEHRHAIEHDRAGATSFIGSFPDDDGPGQGVIVVRGDVDAATVYRIALHIDGLLAAATRFLLLEASAVDSYDGALLDLLGRTQHRLSRRRGLLQVRGLHPSLLRQPANDLALLTEAPSIRVPPAPAPRGATPADEAAYRPALGPAS